MISGLKVAQLLWNNQIKTNNWKQDLETIRLDLFLIAKLAVSYMDVNISICKINQTNAVPESQIW